MDVDVVVECVVEVDELVLFDVDVEVDVEVECVVEVELVVGDVVVVVEFVVVVELLVVDVDIDVVVVTGPTMVSVPGTAATVMVSGPLWASMLAGVNVKRPLATGVNAPTLISRISP